MPEEFIAIAKRTGVPVLIDMAPIYRRRRT